MLEPVNPATLEAKLIDWMGMNPNATQNEAVQWLTTLRDERGRELCAKRRAYRLWERVSNG